MIYFVRRQFSSIQMGCFDNDELYKHVKSPQRRDVREFLEEFGGALNWRSDGEDTLLDVGCGSGDMTTDFILPILPKNFKRLVGVDASKQLIQQAQQQNVQSKVFFEQFDIGVDEQKQSLQHVKKPVDHITALHSFHWVKDHKQAIQNFYNLLKPNGDCLVLLVACCAVYEAWEQMAQSSKWSKYMEDVDRFMGRYQHSADPANEFGRLFRDCDFSEYRVEVRENCAVHEDYNALKRKLHITIKIILVGSVLIVLLFIFRLLESSQSFL